MYGIGVFFAIREAMQAAGAGDVPFHSPITPERVLMGLERARKSKEPRSVRAT